MATVNPQVASSVNMPGGGAGKSMNAEKKAVHSLYTTPKPNEKADVDATKIAALKSNKKRPAPLKRKSSIKLDKAAKKALISSRKEAAEKYKERSEQFKKDLEYRKRAVSRETKREQSLTKSAKKGRPSKKMNNCTMIYSVGPQPKHAKFSQTFREFRKLNRFSPVKQAKEITFIYKVGQPIASK